MNKKLSPAAHKLENTITELRKRTEDLELERAKADAIFQSIGDGAIATDETGKIQKINQAALDMLGYTHEEIVGKWFPRMLIAEDAEERQLSIIDRPISQALITGKPYSAKLFYRRKDGSRLPVAITVSPIILGRRPIGSIEVFRDITVDYEMDKMKDEFISIASHQLRTPATGVKQYVGMLLQGYAGKLTPKQLRMLQNAYDSNERQLKIVDDLLRVAHLDAGKVQLETHQVNLVELLKDVTREQADKLRQKDQNVRISFPTRDITVEVDMPRIRMAFENLLDNAGKYSPEGSEIKISVRNDQTYTWVSIADSGVGIGEEDLKKLFKKFSRLNNPLSHLVSGSGLGLYWAKKIVDLHDGDISVESKPGKGTTFHVKIPVKSS
jgi:PAS domain S-box-containing protein